jgi:hypothetical protein
MLGLQLHLLHQPGPLDRCGEAGIVLDIRGDHQLAARLEAGDQHRLQHGARRVDRRCIARGSRADDDHFPVLMLVLVGHAVSPGVPRRAA